MGLSMNARHGIMEVGIGGGPSWLVVLQRTDGFMSKQSNGFDTSVQVYLIQPLWFGDSVDGQTQKVTLN